MATLSELKSLLEPALVLNNINLSTDAQDKLLHYLVLLTRWNQVFNLTTITKPKEMVYLHIIDSLLVAPFVHGQNLLDVGSGAGLPGIPLAILHPETKWTLLDKNNKKTRFLTQAVAELALKNVKIVKNHAQEFHPEQLFDSILSRAFGSLKLFLESTQHLLSPSGIWIALKGKYPKTEMDELSNHFVIQNVTPINIKGMSIERHILSIRFVS